jgi:polyisoprenoid-binding protein YceI
MTTLRTYDIDTSHSRVSFSVRHLVIAKVRGEFARYSGTIRLDEDDVTRSSVRVELDAASLDTREPKRDDHLRSADFFDVETFPSLTFVSTRVIAEAGKVVRVLGDLTIRDVTRAVTLEVEDGGRVRDPWGGDRAAFTARTRIDRKDFGLRWNVALEAGGFVVGDAIDIELDVEAVAAAAVQKAS